MRNTDLKVRVHKVRGYIRASFGRLHPSFVWKATSELRSERYIPGLKPRHYMLRVSEDSTCTSNVRGQGR